MNRIFNANIELMTKVTPKLLTNYQPFNKEITQMIKFRNILATIDILLRENKIK